MTTELTDKEFESRLADLTTIGEPSILGTPFGIFAIFDLSGRPFYGEFDKKEFRITRNKVNPAADILRKYSRIMFRDSPAIGPSGGCHGPVAVI
jgi:hypothetical protein